MLVEIVLLRLELLHANVFWLLLSTIDGFGRLFQIVPKGILLTLPSPPRMMCAVTWLIHFNKLNGLNKMEMDIKKIFQTGRWSLWIVWLRNRLVKTIYFFLSPIYLILVNTIIQLHPYSYVLPQVSRHFRQDFNHDLASFLLQTVNFAQPNRESLT